MGLAVPDTAVQRLATFAAILEERGIREGLLGPNERERIVPRHVLESCALIPLLGGCDRLIDVGSGAGLPGIPLACLRGDKPTILLEASERRAAFLVDVIAELGLAAEVLAGRAEESARTELRASFDAATCRALAAPAVALELCMPFVRTGGLFVWLATPGAAEPGSALDGSSPAQATVRVFDAGDGASAPRSRANPGVLGDPALDAVARELGGGPVRAQSLEVPGGDVPRWAMIVEKIDATPDRFPRRTGVPARRPLG